MQFLYESGLIAKGRRVLDLRGADLRNAGLFRADLKDATLVRANLKWVLGLTDDQLRAVGYLNLQGATMPDGQIIEIADDPDGPNLEVLESEDLEDWLQIRLEDLIKNREQGKEDASPS